jgi:predicted regulator of Ras-like GTPase activity (Roadblock/LC7/MglB family)
MHEIKDREGIIGYILRGSKSAAIDLKDPTKMIEYAILSSTIFEAGDELTNDLQIGAAKSILIESEKMKLLSMDVNDNRLTIFMEKNVDHNKLYNNLK